MTDKCKVNGCNYPAHARGYCATHYGQLWRTGGHAMQEELRELQASLDEAQICYDRVVASQNASTGVQRLKFSNCAVRHSAGA